MEVVDTERIGCFDPPTTPNQRGEHTVGANGDHPRDRVVDAASSSAIDGSDGSAQIDSDGSRTPGSSGLDMGSLASLHAIDSPLSGLDSTLLHASRLSSGGEEAPGGMVLQASRHGPGDPDERQPPSFGRMPGDAATSGLMAAVSALPSRDTTGTFGSSTSSEMHAPVESRDMRSHAPVESRNMRSSTPHSPSLSFSSPSSRRDASAGRSLDGDAPATPPSRRTSVLLRTSADGSIVATAVSAVDDLLDSPLRSVDSPASVLSPPDTLRRSLFHSPPHKRSIMTTSTLSALTGLSDDDGDDEAGGLAGRSGQSGRPHPGGDSSGRAGGDGGEPGGDGGDGGLEELTYSLSTSCNSSALGIHLPPKSDSDDDSDARAGGFGPPPSGGASAESTEGRASDSGHSSACSSASRASHTGADGGTQHGKTDGGPAGAQHQQASFESARVGAGEGAPRVSAPSPSLSASSSREKSALLGQVDLTRASSTDRSAVGASPHVNTSVSSHSSSERSEDGGDTSTFTLPRDHDDAGYSQYSLRTMSPLSSLPPTPPTHQEPTPFPTPPTPVSESPTPTTKLRRRALAFEEDVPDAAGVAAWSPTRRQGRAGVSHAHPHTSHHHEPVSLPGGPPASHHAQQPMEQVQRPQRPPQGHDQQSHGAHVQSHGAHVESVSPATRHVRFALDDLQAGARQPPLTPRKAGYGRGRDDAARAAPRGADLHASLHRCECVRRCVVVTP